MNNYVIDGNTLENNSLPINKIVCGDTLSVLKKLPDESIDLVVTSPPYNLSNSTGNWAKSKDGAGFWGHAKIRHGYDLGNGVYYSDNMPYNEYIEWQRNVLSECMRVLKDDGAIFYNHKWRVQRGLIQDRHEILEGFPVRQIIIWHRPGGINFQPHFFLPNYEVIYMITKPKFRLAPKANAHGCVWYFAPARNNPHPAPFPEELIDRIITSTKAQLILDPFAGSGTVAISSLKAHRQFILVELSTAYVDQVNKRINEYVNECM